ncbi:ABC transporter permease subunit [Embleya scabrispora]|uniref:ABC transporter permease subunit n=1 Tax=Embleya scabrispora TaxID=159449 RepID=UPI000380E859|nr:ABC transporter permease subunit [Embleya scabrispora]MYS87567.1 ABC transporter permease [Streptomyces sp. SID5474]
MRWFSLPRGVLAAEWIKLRTLRSMYYTAVISAVAALGLGAFDLGNLVADWDGLSAERQAAFDPVRFGFSGGYYVVVLALGTLGALVGGSEYGSGLIATTYTAVPRRRRVFAAKVAVTGAATFVAGEVIAFATFFMGQGILADKHLNVSLGDPHVLRAVTATGAFVSVLAVIGLALGTIVRHSAGAIAALFGLFFVAPMLTEAAGDAVERGTLQPAFQALSSTTGPVDPSRPSTAAACVVCVVWLAVALAVAAWSVERRDV